MVASVCRCGSRRTSTRRIPTARPSTSINAAALVVALVLGGCGSSWRSVPYEDISKQLRGFEPVRIERQLFRTRTELETFLLHLDPGRTAPLPNTDWQHREAILVAMGPRSSSGYSLHVVRLRARGSRVVITVHEQTPSLADHVTPGVTYPFVLITIPRIATSLGLHMEGRP